MVGHLPAPTRAETLHGLDARERSGRAGLPRGPEAARLPLWQAAVPPHVAALAAGDQVDGRLLADVAHLAHGGRVHPHRPARSEHHAPPVIEAHLDPAPVEEVELLLLLVVVAARLIARRQLDRVHPERGHAKRPAQLAE